MDIRSIWKKLEQISEATDMTSIPEELCNECGGMLHECGHGMIEESYQKGQQVVANGKPATVVGSDADTVYVQFPGVNGTTAVAPSQVKAAQAAAPAAPYKRGDKVTWNGQPFTYVRPFDAKQSYVTSANGADDIAPNSALKPAVAEGHEHDHDDEEVCPECDGAGCPECYGEEDRDRAYDHARGMQRESDYDDDEEVCPECDGEGCPECYSDEHVDRAHDHAQGVREGEMSSRKGDKGETIRKHTAKAGGYGRKIDKDDDSGDKFHGSDIDDSDDEEPTFPAVKRGRGRPQKGGDSETGKVKQYDTDTLASWLIGKLPKNHKSIGKPSVKHKLKDWMERVETNMISESIIAEGKMSQLAAMVDEIDNGEIDLHDIVSGDHRAMNSVEEFLQKKLQDKYDEIADKNGLDPQKDSQQVYEIMRDEIHTIISGKEINDTYGAEYAGANVAKDIGLDEMMTQQPGQTGTPQPGQTGTPQPGQTGAAQQPAATAQAGQQQQQPVPIKVNGQVVGTAPNASVVSQATQKLTQNANNSKELAKMGVTTGLQKESAANQSRTTQLNESALEEIKHDFPHECKMFEEGWGMAEGLFHALCDHYNREGKIPREHWHNPKMLRDCVEECYAQDTMPVMGESEMDEGVFGALGTGAGRALGAEAGPIGSMVGGAVGGAIGDKVDDKISDTFGEESSAASSMRKMLDELDMEFEKSIADQGISALHTNDLGTTDEPPFNIEPNRSVMRDRRDRGSLLGEKEVGDVVGKVRGQAEPTMGGGGIGLPPLGGPIGGPPLGAPPAPPGGAPEPLAESAGSSAAPVGTKAPKVSNFYTKNHAFASTSGKSSKRAEKFADSAIGEDQAEEELSALHPTQRSGAKEKRREGEANRQLQRPEVTEPKAMSETKKKESTQKRDDRAERAGKKVTKDIEWDEKHGKKKKVNELSTATLKSYQDKANLGPEMDKFDRGVPDKFNQRFNGNLRASQKLNRKEYEADNAASQVNEKDEGKHNNATTGFKALAKKAAKEYGSKAAGERVAGAVRAKMAKAGKLEESDYDSRDAYDKWDPKHPDFAKNYKKYQAKCEKEGKKATLKDYIASLKKKVKESAKPDFLDIDKDGNKKESMKKAAADKKKIKESVEFQSWDSQLESLIKEDVTINTTTSTRPDANSINVSATGEEAGHLMALLKNAGMTLNSPEQGEQPAGELEFEIDSDGGEMPAGEIEYGIEDGEACGDCGCAPCACDDGGRGNAIKDMIQRMMSQQGGEGEVEVEVMEDLDSSIYTSAETKDEPETKQVEDIPLLAVPRGMGVSVPGEDEAVAVVVEPVFQDEVIDGLEGESEQDDGEGTMDFIKKMMKHGSGEYNVAKVDASGQFQDSMPTSSGKERDDYKSEIDEDNFGSTQQAGMPATGSSPSPVGSQPQKPTQTATMEDEMEEGNEFSGARKQAMDKGEKSFKVGDKEYPVKGKKEAVEESEVVNPRGEFGAEEQGTAAQNAAGAAFKFESQSSLKSLIARMDEIESEKALTEWANSPTGQSKDEDFTTDMEYMTRDISGGLNRMKQDQTTLGQGPLRVKTTDEMNNVDETIGARLRKLAGIN